MSTKQAHSPIRTMEDNGVYLLMEPITFDSCSKVMKWIFSENLQTENKKEELTLMICSPGGVAAACFALIDTMKGSTIPIKTVGLGMIASCGFLLFISGEKGRRILTPNTAILSHQFSGGSYGKEHELLASRKQFDLLSERIIEHYKNCTGLSEKKIKKYLLPEKDVWLSAQEAKDLGICDEIKELGKHE